MGRGVYTPAEGFRERAGRVKHTERDVRRMAGHLLLHHRTTGWPARDRNGLERRWSDKVACCWCLWGAIRAVERALGVKMELILPLETPELWSATQWDNATDQERKGYALMLSQS